MADGSGPHPGLTATPVVGPLSVTPLYTSTGDDIVWWDGVQWQTLIAGAPQSPPVWDGGSTIWDGGLTVWSS